jgi:hypothetical protein
LGEQHSVDFVCEGATHLVLAEEQTQIVGMMLADELARLHFQETAGEFACMPVAPAAALIPKMVEVDRDSWRHSPPQPSRYSGDHWCTH